MNLYKLLLSIIYVYKKKINNNILFMKLTIKPLLEYKDNSLYIERLFKMTFNKIRKTNIICIYCKGFGFLKCHYCKNGCWKCNNSTLIKCIFCSGNGEGRYAYIKSSKNK